ncbi:MAG: efflux RND transporter periplasmic adaptor subunit [Verrucomicrobia bacterium]|nr:efflux RND transporter periplasmic adaptor subunit [Verrucomicrobiota bacterium]
MHQPLKPTPPPRVRILPWILVALGCVVLGVLGFKVIVHERNTDQQKARTLRGPIPVEVAPARIAAIEEVVGGSGQIVQYTTVNVTARLPARIVELPVNIGVFVKAGDLIARFDDRVPKATVAANRELLEASRTKAKNYETQLKRLTALQERHMAADYDVETAESNLATAKQTIAAAQQALAQAEVDLEYTVLKSPVNGIVIDRPANLGETAKLDETIAVIGEIDNVYLKAIIGEEKIGSINLNMAAEASFDAYPGEVFKGTVEKIDPQTNPLTHAFATYIKIPNPGWRLKPGLTGFARLSLSRRALTVPSTAVLNPVGDHPSVFVIDSAKRAHQRAVRIGKISGALTEILDGLQEGETIVVTGQMYVLENDEVRVNAANAPR